MSNYSNAFNLTIARVYTGQLSLSSSAIRIWNALHNCVLLRGKILSFVYNLASMWTRNRCHPAPDIGEQCPTEVGTDNDR